MERERSIIDQLLQHLFDRFGFDYRNYSYSSIRRRIHHRMILEQIDDLSQFCEQALADSLLREKIVADFSLLVTTMFRDPNFFASFRTHVLPWLRRIPYVRIWHAGCATGEEVLSMAILLREEGLLERCRIFATDLSETALNRAMRGAVDMHAMQMYTRNYIQFGGQNEFSAYYTIRGNEALFDPMLLSRVVFARHNLATDHAFQSFHAIVCRNVIIYFNPILKKRVYSLFTESLCGGGYLGLGSKESLLGSDCHNRYEYVDPSVRIYRIKEGL